MSDDSGFEFKGIAQWKKGEETSGIPDQPPWMGPSDNSQIFSGVV